MTMLTLSDFPLKCGGTTIYSSPLPHLPKPRRRQAERQAIDALIRENISPTARLDHLPSGAPVIIDSPLHISISHAADTVLLAVNPIHTIGIDIEAPRPQLLRIARRFMTPEEYRRYGRSLDAALAVWTAKEATFKAAAIPDLTIGEIQVDLSAGIATARSRQFRFHHFRLTGLTVCLTPI